MNHLDYRRWDRVPPHARIHPELRRAALSVERENTIARWLIIVGCLVFAVALVVSVAVWP